MRATESSCSAGNVSVLFSEPKIPQSELAANRPAFERCFSALQRAENSSMCDRQRQLCEHARFSALQRAENSSMLGIGKPVRQHNSFSALQRAENSSIAGSRSLYADSAPSVSVLFSEPKIPQSLDRRAADPGSECFSALQRAENSSMPRASLDQREPTPVSVLFSEPKIPQSFTPLSLPLQTVRFQCSSASRKFLNPKCRKRARRNENVSVLFSEPKIPQCYPTFIPVFSAPVSVLFSEPKIPQSLLALLGNGFPRAVSVLFSEPKIPQLGFAVIEVGRCSCFSALQRAENSSIWCVERGGVTVVAFQCSSASRKFLNRSVHLALVEYAPEFQCSSASRKFLNPH